ncbi:class I SAM-dependent methyltransferase [Ornithinibacillus halotolerans]|uniref:SAM-dependent methyltransferase n=1 Tax=Ornithinibacillus halotolerans TaxID=1274357 RepID=A0A916RMX0_9BACI|nr:class I SAM-dependent methyltransferase [Ornithinibacillus halotolerans]GGA62140.1 hypothetical protein GCM10008025_02600 [Ornithinibacillus halotolerans]
MIITTSGKPSINIVSKAKQLSKRYNLPYIERLGVSIQTLKNEYKQDVIIVGSEKLVISPLSSDKELFFHPNLAYIRAKRILRGERDPFIEIAKLKEGMSLLDCTLGLASDSILASFVVGTSGKVTGIEGNELIYFIVKEGLTTFKSKNKYFNKAMQSIHVVHNDYLTYLLSLETNAYDVVYFDPMFQNGIETSTGINIIREQAIMTDMTEKVITEAKRVARQRVILKDHWKSDRFDKFGFNQLKRKTALFHYGTIELLKS